ncbi:MAG TPA: hypothetical protein VFA10_20105 [Ktedonobacteraceae bacterium]|nr:hypothetical protein [Ktedonobacteraceae bacterium]
MLVHRFFRSDDKRIQDRSLPADWDSNWVGLFARSVPLFSSFADRRSRTVRREPLRDGTWCDERPFAQGAIAWTNIGCFKWCELA